MSNGDGNQKTCYLCKSNEIDLYYPASGESDELMERAFLITDSDYHSYPAIFQCKYCNLIFSDPDSETAAPLPYYQDMIDPDYHEEASGRVIPFRRILRQTEKFVSPGKILDIGAATGIFLSEARFRKWEPFGVEPSVWAVSEARNRYDLEIIPGTVAEARFADEMFDAVALLDVLEHVSDPLELLEEIHRILKPGGMLVLTTPNIGSFIAKLLGEKWWHIRRAHQYYFNARTVKNLMKKAGFQIRKRKYYPWAFSVRYWISRFEHFNAPIHKILTRFTKTSLGKVFLPKVVKLNFYDSFELYLIKEDND